RNVGLPLGFGFLSAFFFSGIVYYLLNINHAAERSVAEVAVAHETFKVLIDLESGMRGFLIAGEEEFLAPYIAGLPVFEQWLADLREQVGDDPVQVRRVDRIEALENQWNDYAALAIEQRRQGLPIFEYVRSGHGRQLIRQMRNEFNDLIVAERQKRNA